MACKILVKRHHTGHTKINMTKQTKSRKVDLHLRLLQKRRAMWFAVLLIGLLLIQFAYNARLGEPRILGYSTDITERQLLDSTNQLRADNGLPALALNQKLHSGAHAKANDMIARDYWDHLTPDGKQPWTFFANAGYKYSAAGENLAYGFRSGSEVVTAWEHSQTHRANLLGNFKEVGFGIVHSPHYQGNDATVIVAFYGSPDPHTPPFTLHGSSSQHINGISVVTSGGANWSIYASFALIGASAVGFIVTHMELLRYGWYNTKRYLLIHPVADAGVIVSVSLLLVFTINGFIR